MPPDPSRARDVELEARDWPLLIRIRDESLSDRARRDAGAELIGNYDGLIGAIVSREIFNRERTKGERLPNREEHVAESMQEARVRIWREAKINRSYTVPFRVVVTHCVRWAVRDYLTVLFSTPDPTDRMTELLDVQVAEEDFDFNEARTIFVTWLDEQEERDRTIVTRCWLQGAPSKEVAREVGLSPGAVDTRKSRLAGDFRLRFKA